MLPRTLFSSDHELFRNSVRKFFEQHAAPFHAQWEKQGHIDRTLWNRAGEQGMLCSHLPEEYGGMGADFLYTTVVIEEISRLGLTGIGFSLHSDIVAPYILHYGSEALKLKYLPKLVSGELVTAIAMPSRAQVPTSKGSRPLRCWTGMSTSLMARRPSLPTGFLLIW